MLNYLIRERSTAKAGRPKSRTRWRKIDIVAVAKPAIYVPDGCLVVTAAGTLQRDECATVAMAAITPGRADSSDRLFDTARRLFWAEFGAPEK